MWRGKKVSVVFPTYNEKDSIRAAILDYFGADLIDEVIVVNNNAAPGTSQEVAGTGAIEIFEQRQGYGNALMCGIDHASGDLIILSEPDGTLHGNDVLKLLAYSDDMPVVFGTRTSREFIWKGANMGWFLRWGNWAVAKLTEVLFNTTILTDMGCTKRLVTREAMQLIRPHLTYGGSQFGAQFLMEVVAHRIPFVEVPVNYRSRVGRSSVTGSFWRAFWLGLQMIGMVMGYRLGFYPRRCASWPLRGPRTVESPSFACYGADAMAGLEGLRRITGSDAGPHRAAAPQTVPGPAADPAAPAEEAVAAGFSQRRATHGL